MMMIEIDDDIYEYLRKQQTTFSGESASVLLRRLLKLESSNPPNAPISKPQRPLSPEMRRDIHQEIEEKMQQDGRIKPLWEFLKEPQFKARRSAVGRFLALLAAIERQNPGRFGAVENINGRTRKYFAKSRADLEQSGTNVNAKRIPGSEYWVVTNNSSQSKTELLLQVMKTLAYDGGFAAFVSVHSIVGELPVKAA